MLGGTGRLAGRWLPPTLYGASCLVVGLALLDRRRRDVDPATRRRQQTFSEELARIRSAGALPPGEGAAALAQALRRMLQESPSAANREIDALLGDCDVRRYAPAGTQTPLPAGLIEQATRLAEAIAQERA